MEENGDMNITCAGLPKNCLYKKDEDNNIYKYTQINDARKQGIKLKDELYYKDEKGKEKIMTLENFKEGLSVGGKLMFKHVKRWCHISRNRIFN